MTQEIPRIELLITDSAIEQIKLMKMNDYTLHNKDFRIAISGKGCHGFDYQLGFSPHQNQDKKIEHAGVTLLMDEFTYFYCQKIKLDYLRDSDSDEEGFVLTNFEQHRYEGKFFKDSSLVPNGEKK